MEYDRGGEQKYSLAPPPRRKHQLASLIRLWPYMRPQAWKFVLMIVIDVITIGVAIIIPLITRHLIDGPVAARDKAGVIWWGLAAVLIGAVSAVLVFVRRWIVSRAMATIEFEIRREMYAKLQVLPMDFHRSWESGQLLSRIMTDLGMLRRFLAFGGSALLTSLLQIVIVALILLQIHWPLGLLVVAMVIPVSAVCAIMENRLWKVSRQIQDRNGDVASNAEEAIQGLRVIRGFGRRRFAMKKFDQRAVALHDSWIERIRLTSVFWMFLEVIPNLTLIVVMVAGGFATARGELSMGTLVAFITLLLALVWPMASLGFLLPVLQESSTAADRVCEVFDAENTIVSGSQRIENPRGHLELRNVSYQFPDASEPLLSNVNLVLQPGETVAIVGGTGSGKSTLTNLIPRLVDVTDGQVLIDGVDVRDLDLEHLRTLVATAFEEPTLFSMSVRENLTFGRPEASEEAVRRAIDVAQAHFVDDLPWGLDTRIGEQGMSLSGGQRQRLALARAVLTEPRILVLDDTLSALDIHTEALVEEALGRVLNGVTAIIVAHRASTVMLADRVAMISGGTITHIGQHEELLATVPQYRELLSADFEIEEEWEFLEGAKQHG